MIVAELIEHLKKYPGDRRVVVSGYERGYCDVSDPRSIAIVLNVNRKEDWFNGPHDKASGELGEKSEQAVLIDGKDEVDG